MTKCHLTNIFWPVLEVVTVSDNQCTNIKNIKIWDPKRPNFNSVHILCITPWWAMDVLDATEANGFRPTANAGRPKTEHISSRILDLSESLLLYFDFLRTNCDVVLHEVWAPNSNASSLLWIWGRFSAVVEHGPWDLEHRRAAPRNPQSDVQLLPRVLHRVVLRMEADKLD